MMIKTLLDMYKNIKTNVEIKSALGLCTPGELGQLVGEGNLDVLLGVIDLLANYIEGDPVIIERKKMITERRMMN